MAFALKATKKKVVAKPAPAAKTTKPVKKVGVAVKSTKPAAKSTKDMTPLEKARAARAAGGGVKKKATAKPARKPLPTFDAPADFKSHFLEVSLRTEKDGLLASQIKATR